MSGVEEMVLVPRPRRIESWGPGPHVEALRIEEAVEPDVPREGFRLTLTDTALTGTPGARIDHRDTAGLRYAHQLLDQLVTQSTDGRLPALRVEDHPDIPVRGFVLDISRDRVPTRATLGRIVELASLARLNQLQLYMEHTFAYADHGEVWHDSSPITPDDLAWLDALCADRGIELVPNQNCFGHMGRWLAHDTYRGRAECPEGWEPLPGVTFPPSVLAPTAENAAFALGLLGELLASFRSGRVNIGGDEPFELGRGASRALVAEQGMGRVYLDHLRRLIDPLRADGYEVQIWADVLRHHPDLADDLPAGVVPIAWCYEAPTPDGRPVAVPDGVAEILANLGTGPEAFSGFALCVAPLIEADIPFWVAAGTSSWSSLVGRVDNACANLLDAAQTARACGSGGYLITDWGDNGHHQPPSVSFGPLVYGGAVAWGLDANRDLDLGLVLDRHVFLDPAGRVSGAVDTLGHQWARTGQRSVNGSPLDAALFPHQFHLVLGRPDLDRVGSVIADIEGAISTLGRAEPDSADGPIVIAELTQAARLARHGAWRLLGPGGPSAGARRDDMVELIEGQRTTWLHRSRPGGLSDSLARLDPTLAATVDIPRPDRGDGS